MEQIVGGKGILTTVFHDTMKGETRKRRKISRLTDDVEREGYKRTRENLLDNTDKRARQNTVC